MKYEIDQNKNLKIYADIELQQELTELGDDIQQDAVMHDILEPLTCNSDIEWVAPEEINALTDAPILGTVTRDDMGEITEVHAIWWYPNYAIRSPLEDLRDDGFTIFIKE